MRRRWFLWIVLVILPSTVLAQTGSVEGVARDALQRPLAGASIRMETPDGTIAARASTQADGHFSLSNLAPGTYSLIGAKTGFDEAIAIVTVGAAAARGDLTLAAKAALDLAVTARLLAEARTAIEPRIGATTYTLSNQAIAAQPGGDDAPLNETLLQAPGVSQDSFGQIHVRNEHANVQYRIDGVILPEGISFFGQSLTSRFASSIDLITGSLPAQYGLATAGIVDIATKSGAFEPGGSVGLYGGSHGWIEPSAEYAGSAGGFSYFVAGDYLRDDLGIENPIGSYGAIHDATQQAHGFAYLEDVLDPTSKVSAIFGAYRGDFQIPNNPGQAPAFTLGTLSTFNSALLNENQREINDYAALAYLKSQQDFDLQLSAFVRYSLLQFSPDPVGDLIFNGIAQSATRTDLAEGFQADGTYRLTPEHTLRFGALVTAERAVSDSDSLVFPGGPGFQTSTVPVGIVDNGAKIGWTYSVYAQDEWRVTPALTINAGGRFDVLNAFTDTSQFSPRLNAVWKPDAATTLHLGYARYFTPPPMELVSGNSIAKFIGTSGEPPNTLDSVIRPERAHYFDVGTEHEFAPGLKLGVDAYYKFSRDLIDEGQFGAPIILTAFNYKLAQNRGVELTGGYNVGNWSIYGNLAIAEQRAKDIVSAQFNFDPAELAYIATHTIFTDHSQWVTGSGGVSYLWDGTRLSADVILGSGLRAGFANLGTVAPYTQVNLGVSHRFENTPSGPVELRFDIVNLFDRSYEIRTGTGVGVGAPQFGPRRTFYAGIRKYF